MATETLDLKFEASEEWKKAKAENYWLAFVPETAEKDGTRYMKGSGGAVYRETKDGYLCNSCGSEIMAGRVAHSIHDGPFPLSGSGRVHNEDVPYCPKCEKVPATHGTPITVRG